MHWSYSTIDNPVNSDILNNVMGVTKMGNIVSRAGIESTSLALQASVLPLHDIGFLPDVTTICTATCLCSSLPQRSVQTTILVPLEL